MRKSTIFLSVIMLIGVAATWYGFLLLRENMWVDRMVMIAGYDEMGQVLQQNRQRSAGAAIKQLESAGCVLFDLGYSDEPLCAVGGTNDCLENIPAAQQRIEPLCVDYGVGRIETPESVRGIYMTSLVAGNTSFRERLMRIADETEINTIMIDIKEVDGYVAFKTDNEKIEFQKNIMYDITDLIAEMHERDIYVIGRIVLFKDKAWAAKYPEMAVQKKDRPGSVWTDYGGKKFIDVGAEPFWDYLVELSSVAYDLGFDEINADYIRFPSDGNMKNTHYPYSQKYIDEMGGEDGRVYSLNQFMEYYTSQLRERHPDIVLSADVFGMVTSLENDLTIGQKQEPFMEHFDYVMPMVYPSHYPRGFVNLPGHPDNHPYEILKKSMDDAVGKAERAGQNPDKIRPWLQDFTCTWCTGYFPYRAAELREQIDATYDAGLDSWFLWNAANRYTTGGLLGPDTE